MTTNRYTIDVERIGVLTGHWANHVVIDVSTPLTGRDSLTDTVMTQRWTAGVITRLAVTLADDMAEQIATCGCPNVCRLRVSDPIVDFGALLDSRQPGLMLYVNRDAETHWLRLIKSHIATINKADRWRPTTNEERTWHGPPTEHVTAPPFNPVKADAR